MGVWQWIDKTQSLHLLQLFLSPESLL